MQIERDRWGVPHIQAPSEIDAIFAQGYAQAEDRLPTIMRAYRIATGQMSAAFGADWIEHDFTQRVFRHVAVARNGYTTLAAPYRAAAEAFIAGIKRYIEQHPHKAPSWSLQPEPWHILALARTLNWDFIIRQGYHDLGQPLPSTPGAGSNAWAYVEGEHVYFVSDPHLPWRDEWLMHECSLSGGELEAHGFQTPGLPYIRFGHNQHVAWTFTSGGADVCDAYQLTLNDDGTHYLFDRDWLELNIETLRVGTEQRRQVYSHHGPLMMQEGRTAYAFRSAYADRLFEHIAPYARLNKARSTTEVQDILADREFGPFNILVADRDGHIFWQSTGAVPIRPAGYDSLRPLPGDTTATEWHGLHSTSNLPQLVDPPWIQHCNVTPWAMIPNSPLTEENYPTYMLYGEKPTYVDGSNPRGRYLSAQLAATETMTTQRTQSLLMDCYMAGAQVWLKALFAAYAAHQEDYAHLAPAIERLQHWDGLARQDRVGITIFWEWYLAMPADEDFDRLWNQLLSNEALTPHALLTMLEALEDAMAYLLEQWGTLDVPWGQVYRGQRGNESWPLDGCIGMALRVIGGSWEPDEAGVYYPSFGQSCPMLVILGPEGVYSYSVLPFGQSEDPQSPHYNDQGPQWFAHGKLKER